MKTLRFGNRSLARGAVAPCQQPENTTAGSTGIVTVAILNSMQMKSQVFNTDCLAAMREMPDNAFDLAVVDPPYGEGCSQSGNVEREREREVEPVRRKIRQVQVSTTNGRIAENQTGRGVTRIGGTWATKYAKKLLRGTLRRNKNILRSCFASHEIR